MKVNNIKKISLIGLIIFPFLGYASTDAVLLSTNSLNYVLITIAFVLLIPIAVLGKLLTFSIKAYFNKIKDKTNIILFLLLSLPLISNAESSVSIIDSNYIVSWIIISLIALETIIIIILAYFALKYLRGFSQIGEITKEKAPSSFKTFWEKFNNFKPIDQEKDLDTGHEYDGIRELNNITPPWFTYSYILTIVFAIVYLYRYHVAKSAPLMIEEYEIEMASAEKIQKISDSKTVMYDESNIKLLPEAEIEKGKVIFTNNCISCHGEKAQSDASKVGPNLTDNYWIHGGSIQDVFKSVKYGWPEKGMIAWKDILGPSQIAQVTSYLETLKGKNIAGGKAPQGELYKPNTAIDTTKK